MKKLVFTSLVSVISAVVFGTAAFAAPQCGPHKQVIEMLDRGSSSLTARSRDFIGTSSSRASSTSRRIDGEPVRTSDRRRLGRVR